MSYLLIVVLASCNELNQESIDVEPNGSKFGG